MRTSLRTCQLAFIVSQSWTLTISKRGRRRRCCLFGLPVLRSSYHTPKRCSCCCQFIVCIQLAIRSSGWRVRLPHSRRSHDNRDSSWHCPWRGRFGRRPVVAGPARSRSAGLCCSPLLPMFFGSCTAHLPSATCIRTFPACKTSFTR